MCTLQVTVLGMTGGSIICDLVCQNRDLRHEVFGYFNLSDLFCLAGVDTTLRSLLADDRRLCRIRDFLDAHVGQSINYNRTFDATTCALVKDGDSRELDFIYPVINKDAAACYSVGRVRKWLEEGFAQSWMFDRPAHARWFATANVGNAFFLHDFYGCTISLSTVSHCMFISHRTQDKRKLDEIYHMNPPKDSLMHEVYYKIEEYRAEIVAIESVDAFKGFLRRADVVRWLDRPSSLSYIKSALKGGPATVVEFFNNSLAYDRSYPQ